jgi:predicted ATPase/DNA-binding winged helix-turn-helix (wHTH) protein
VLDERTRGFAFGPFLLLPLERRLEIAGTPIHLGSRALDLLIILVERAGEIVPAGDLLESVWAGVTVEESSLRFHIRNLRKVFGENHPGADRYVTNVSGRGYCFAAPVERVDQKDRPRNSPFASKANLPARAGSVIGRSNAMNAVLREVLEKRLVTIVGSAGIGKTTLAIAVADSLRANFSNAVFFVDLSPIVDPAHVFGALASTLGVAPNPKQGISAVIEFLRDKRIVIVFDNCEQVVDAVAQVADGILRDAENVHMLATSREPLRITGERVHRLLPLEYPPSKASITADEAMGYGAVQLFVERAAACMSQLSIDDENAPAVVEICRRLDGIPLAIELAAAQVEAFGFLSLAKALNDMFAVLTRGRRFALPRHQTLRAALDWGYGLLSPTESAVLRYISIFRAPFALEAALAVVLDPQVARSAAVDALASLVIKSLVVADNAGGVTRYRLLESTRLYARDKLDASTESSDVARRHALYYLSVFKCKSGDQDQPQLSYSAIIDDVRAALDWSFSEGGDLRIGLELISASSQLWFQLSLMVEYSDWIERALTCFPHVLGQSEQDADLEMRLQIASMHARWYVLGDSNAVEHAAARALELAERIGDTSAQLQGLWGLWAAQRRRGRFKAALALGTQYEALARDVGDRSCELLSDRILGLTHHFLGEQELAKLRFERVREVARQTKNAVNTGWQLNPDVAALTSLARINWLQGYPDRAVSTLQEAIESVQRSEHWFSLHYVLVLAGVPLAFWTGDLANVSQYLDLMANNMMTSSSAELDRRRCWEMVLRLRQGDETDALRAAFLEPRLDGHRYLEMSKFVFEPTKELPLPDDEVGDALWSLPEILRVNAEILLWRDGACAADVAESKLLRSLGIAKEQGTLSWELRTATSLARLWYRRDRQADARDLLASTYNRFTEGFATRDLVNAGRLIADWS